MEVGNNILLSLIGGATPVEGNEAGNFQDVINNDSTNNEFSSVLELFSQSDDLGSLPHEKSISSSQDKMIGEQKNLLGINDLKISSEKSAKESNILLDPVSKSSIEMTNIPQKNKLSLVGQSIVPEHVEKSPGQIIENDLITNNEKIQVNSNLNRGVQKYFKEISNNNDSILKSASFTPALSHAPKISQKNIFNNFSKTFSDQNIIDESQTGLIDVLQGQNQNEISNSNAKVLNLSGIKITDSSQLIDQISEYVAQTNLENKESINLLVKHDSLGVIKINVQQSKGVDQLAINLSPDSIDGQNFLSEQGNNLIKTLTDAGIKVGEFNILETQNSSQSSSDQFSNSKGEKNSSNESEFFSENNKQDGEGKEKRQDLWEEMFERKGA
ncbi:MAG: hypothetical protein HOJ35_10405 [Bdellovibrionales bacterium]|nr:hypothetical protein [Bdellovibrionales bacterium]